MTETLVVSIYILVLAIFVGFEVISKVPPLLHTPLMSGSNAISGITLVGSLVTAGEGHAGLSVFLGMLAVIFATINVVGGFMVTDRMLELFKRRETKAKKAEKRSKEGIILNECRSKPVLFTGIRSLHRRPEISQFTENSPPW